MSDIVRGENVSIPVQLAFLLMLPYTELENPIVSSSSDNPAKITFKYPHGLSDDRNVIILGESVNISINGNHSVKTTNDPYTLTLTGVAGVGKGGANKLYLPIDFTGNNTLALTLKKFIGGPALVDGSNAAIQPTFAWNDRSFGSLTWNLLNTDTRNLPINTIILSASFTDSQGQIWIINIPYEVGDA